MKDLHSNDCAVHNEPAYPRGECDCGLKEALVTIMSEEQMRQVARECWETGHTYPKLVAIYQAVDSFREGKKVGVKEGARGVIKRLKGKADVSYDRYGRPSIVISLGRKQWIDLCEEVGINSEVSDS